MKDQVFYLKTVTVFITKEMKWKKIINPYYQLQINFNFTDFYIGNEYQKYSISRKFSQKVQVNFNFKIQINVSSRIAEENWIDLNVFVNFCSRFSQNSQRTCAGCASGKKIIFFYDGVCKKKKKKRINVEIFCCALQWPS